MGYPARILDEEEHELQERIRLTDGLLLADRIRQARRDTGVSHDRLGELCGGVTRQHLIKLEQAKHRPRAAMLRRIADATGRDIDWFLAPPGDRPFGQPGERGTN